MHPKQEIFSMKRRLRVCRVLTITRSNFAEISYLIVPLQRYRRPFSCPEIAQKDRYVAGISGSSQT